MISDPKNIKFERLQEECAELIQAVCKARRFGMFNVHPIEHTQNYDRIKQECADVLVIIESLGIGHKEMELMKELKRKKLEEIEKKEV